MLLQVLAQGEAAPANLANELVEGAMRGVVSAKGKFSGVSLPTPNLFTFVVTNDSSFCH